MSESRREPETLGRYEVVGRLAKGAMGVVYVGRDPKLDRPVALKTLQVSDIVDRETTERLRERFLQEPRITAQLRHPNVVPVYDAGIDAGTGIAWLALELVEGRDLAKLLQQGLTPRRVLEIADDVAAALDHAHQRGIVHRDVKPANVLVDRDGRARLTDFGIAHEIEAERTRPGEFLGSPAYMAPEQIAGGAITARTDVHALAIVLYEALTGRRPFETTKEATTAQAVLSATPEPPSRVNSNLPRALDAVFRKALAKKPEKRHDTCGELAADVRRALASLKPAIDPDAETTTALEEHRARSAGVAGWASGVVTAVRSSARAAAGRLSGWSPMRRLSAAFVAAVAAVALAAWAWPEADAPALVEASPRVGAADAAAQPTAAEQPVVEDEPAVESEPAESGAEETARASEPEPPSVEPREPEDGRAAARAAEPATPAPDQAEPEKPAPRPPEPVPARPEPRRAERRASRGSPTTTLLLDFYSRHDGRVTVLADGAERLSASVAELRSMPTDFRGFAKDRYRIELELPSGRRSVSVRFDSAKGGRVLEESATWELPAGGHALATAEVGFRGRNLELKLLQTARGEDG